jgi:hypothetical protein
MLVRMARAAASFPEFAKRQEALALEEVDKAERDHFWRNCRGAFGDSRLRTSHRRCSASSSPPARRRALSDGVSRAGGQISIFSLKKSRSDPEKTEICTRCCVLVGLGGLVVGFPVGFLTIVSWASRMLA